MTSEEMMIAMLLGTMVFVLLVMYFVVRHTEQKRIEAEKERELMKRKIAFQAQMGAIQEKTRDYLISMRPDRNSATHVVRIPVRAIEPQKSRKPKEMSEDDWVLHPSNPMSIASPMHPIYGFPISDPTPSHSHHSSSSSDCESSSSSSSSSDSSSSSSSGDSGGCSGGGD